MVDIRRKTCLVIRKDGEFLGCRILFTKDRKWSTSPYDAATTRKIEIAQKAAAKYGGEIMLFNPIVGQLRTFA